jgi:energy-coupling factor transport system permease/ATP-binding protein
MAIELNEITVQYPSSPEPSLRQVSTTLHSKTVTLLVGVTGSGKSTLLDVISGLVPPTSGVITVDNMNLWPGTRPRRELLLRFGSVFQYPEHQLFAKSVHGEFAYSLRPWGLNKAQIGDKAKAGLQHVNLPESILPESPFILSGGQKRRVALASTFATSPDWLFLDEPTAGLDPAAVHQLISFVQHYMETEAGQSGGIVIATHDLDVFLPIADEIMLLQNGRLSRHIQTSEFFLHPEWLTDIGIALPPSLQIHVWLGGRGRLGECGCSDVGGPGMYGRQSEHSGDMGGLDRREGLGSQGEAEELGASLPPRYLNPEEMAHILYERSKLREESQNIAYPAGSAKPVTSANAKSSHPPHQLTQSQAYLNSEPFLEPVASQADPVDSKPTKYEKRGFSALDPRTKWLLCLFLSAAMLIQSSWAGLAISVCITLGLLVWSRVDSRTIMRYTKPALLVLLMSVLLAALQFGRRFHIGPIHGIGLGLNPAIVTLKGFIGFLCVVETGLLLPATTSSQDMNQGLAQLLSPLRKLRIPVDALALSASLLLRFIPLILLQLQRFARIAKARGKRSTRSGNIGIRDMPAVVIPLLLAILKLGEDLSLAMEARGYRHAGQKRTVYRILRLGQVDYSVLLATGLVAVLLMGLQFWD